MSIKEYVDQMIIDQVLSNQDKIDLLKVWIEKTQQKIFSSTLHSSELIDLHDGIEHMKNKIVELENHNQ